MKALVNELSPVNSLPPELLSVIPTFWPEGSQRDLIKATHVCRYWRTTLIASHDLWNVVKSGDEAQTRAFIQRSKPYPLSMEIKHPGEESVLSDTVLSRLKSLTLDLPTTNLAKPLRSLVCPTPMLQDLTITSSDPGSYLPVLNTGDFFSLTQLHLDGVAAHFTHLPIPNLKALHVKNTGGTPLLRGFLQFLKRTPWLEELVLVNTGPEGGDEPLERVVRLRSLRALTLHGTVAKGNLLQYLSVPASADINLMGCFNRNLDGFMDQFLPPSLENLPVTSSFTSLTVTSTSRSWCHMGFSSNEGKLSINIKSEPSRYLQFGNGQLTPPTAGRCLQRLTPLVLDTVTHLTIRRGPWEPQVFPEPSALREFLHQLPSLQTIDLVCCHLSSLTALDPAGVRLPFFHTLNLYLAPDAVIDLFPLSHLAKSKLSLKCPLEKVKLVFGSPTRFKGSEMGRLKQHIRVVEVEEVNDRKK